MTSSRLGKKDAFLVDEITIASTIEIASLYASLQTQQQLRKILLVSVKFLVRNSGAGNGCVNFMDA